MLVTEDMHHRVGWSAYSIGLKAGAAARALSTEGRAALRNFCEHVVRRLAYYVVDRAFCLFLSLPYSLSVRGISLSITIRFDGRDEITIKFYARLMK